MNLETTCHFTPLAPHFTAWRGVSHGRLWVRRMARSRGPRPATRAGSVGWDWYATAVGDKWVYDCITV